MISLEIFMERNDMISYAARNMSTCNNRTTEIEAFFCELDKAGEILPQNFYNYYERALRIEKAIQEAKKCL